jgi:hypothetical protein
MITDFNNPVDFFLYQFAVIVTSTSNENVTDVSVIRILCSCSYSYLKAFKDTRADVGYYDKIMGLFYY